MDVYLLHSCEMLRLLHEYTAAVLFALLAANDSTTMSTYPKLQQQRKIDKGAPLPFTLPLENHCH